MSDEEVKGRLPEATMEALDAAAYKYMDEVSLIMSAFSDEELLDFIGDQPFKNGNEHFNHEDYCRYRAHMEIFHRQIAKSHGWISLEELDDNDD